MERKCNDNWEGNTILLGETPVAILCFPPWTSRRLRCDRTRASTVRIANARKQLRGLPWIIQQKLCGGKRLSLKTQTRNVPEGCEQDQGNVRHVSSLLLWYSTPRLPHTRPNWNQPTPIFCISKLWVHKCCSCVYALRQEECRQRSTYSSPLYLLDLGDRFTLVPT